MGSSKMLGTKSPGSLHRSLHLIPRKTKVVISPLFSPLLSLIFARLLEKSRGEHCYFSSTLFSGIKGKIQFFSQHEVQTVEKLE